MIGRSLDMRLFFTETDRQTGRHTDMFVGVKRTKAPLLGIHVRCLSTMKL